ncbi:very low-density lipoprotein receptor-like [Branchiostoma floridae]|uniref:Very low-density lipoprotein receptor-like n=1 Tax=Branchiostoma floridae TaxID=7739 RepID=A0A9J7HVX3_BRAFL|nr:very low-density lipoprotein receptor-like [Branchiostoma floridae]
MYRYKSVATVEQALAETWGSCSYNCSSVYGNASCVPDAFSCDGDADCLEEEDEQGCIEHRASLDGYSSGGADGSAGDMSTQTSATPTAGTTTLDSGETAECPTFYCDLYGSTDPSCVQDHLVCDGQLDCALGEDEQGCGNADDTSTQATITSTAGTTTQDSREAAECPTFYCSLSGSTDLSCVQDHLICDGQLDCVLGEDEQGCGNADDTSTQATTTSTAGTSTQDSGEATHCPTFYCSLSGFPDTSCVQDHLICDGQPDCTLGEDEQGCGNEDDTSTQATITPTVGTTTQDSGETAECLTFYCGLSGSAEPSCVQDHLICDGQPDCALGEDEQGCGNAEGTSTQATTTSTAGTTTQDSGEATHCPTFYCSLSGFPDTSCVRDHLICDGQPDCTLGEDEQGCGNANDTSTQTSITSTAGATTQDSGETAECPTFYCGLPGSMDPSCVQDHLICDGQLDCVLGEDEQGCSNADGTSTQTSPTPSNEPVSYGEQTGFYTGNHGSKNQPVVWLTAAVLGGLIFYRQYF